jgi:hypothetical protein
MPIIIMGQHMAMLETERFIERTIQEAGVLCNQREETSVKKSGDRA